ncbi:MAG: hypothetical protein KGK02_09545 [Rhodospirillales bacterium]|nr:hypothetical protein [Rhodospirillales bacterium]
MENGSKKLTRRELFDLVWSKPIQQLAAEFGVSDRGLAKVCARNGIPNPPRGYWARLAAGGNVKRPPGPNDDERWEWQVKIVPTLSPLATSIMTSRKLEQAHSAKIENDQQSVKTDFTVPVSQPHSAIRNTAQVLRKAKSDAWGAVNASGEGLCGIAVHSSGIERIISILNVIATKLEAEGLNIQPDGNRMKVVNGPDEVRFTLTEKYKRVPHIPSEQELQLYQRQKEKRDRAANRSDWTVYQSLPYKQPWPEHDYVYAGQFAFVIDSWAGGLRKLWSDGKHQSIETLLESIVVGIMAILTYEKLKREERAEAERNRQEYARRSELKKKRDERENQRIIYLQKLIDLQREVEGLEKWLASVPSNHSGEAVGFDQMLLWAKKRLSMLRTQITAKYVADEISKNVLFPETDDLHDPLGDPERPKGYYW